MFFMNLHDVYKNIYIYYILLFYYNNMYGYSMLLRHAASFGSGRMCGVSHLTASAQCSLLSLVLYPNHPSLCDLQASVCMLRTLPWWQKSFLPKPHRCGTSLNPLHVWCYAKNARMILNACSCAVWQLEGWPTCPVKSQVTCFLKPGQGARDNGKSWPLWKGFLNVARCRKMLQVSQTFAKHLHQKL